MEQQLLALQAEKQAAMAAAAKLVEGNTKRSSEYEAECAKLRAELEAIGKEKNKTASQGKGSSICLSWCCLCLCLCCLPTYLPTYPSACLPAYMPVRCTKSTVKFSRIGLDEHLTDTNLLIDWLAD